MSKNFVLIGAAGYVAPRHMKAIKEIGGNLLAMLDPHDSVGVIDTYFTDCQYFSEFERFDRFCSKQRDNGNRIDYVSICSPNYLHDAHIRFALRIGAHAICEKPLALKVRNLEELKVIEKASSKNIHTILQLRLNPILIDIRNKVQSGELQSEKIILNYFTPRGDWYDYTWKSDSEKSGGLATNIGVHLFDLLAWIFGPQKGFRVKAKTNHEICGEIFFGRKASTVVAFHLAIDKRLRPTRTISFDDRVFELSDGFTELHTESYRQIMAGAGYGIDDTIPAIELCEKLR